MVDAPDGFEAPMLCKTVQREDLDDPKKWSEYIAEPKHDGVRCLAKRLAGEVRLYSRTGQDFTDHVPHLAEELNAYMPDGSVLDGELAILKSSVSVHDQEVPVTDFNATMRVLGSLAERGREVQKELGLMSYVLYDFLAWDGVDYTPATWKLRRGWLLGSMPDRPEHLRLNPVFFQHTTFGALFDDLTDYGIEGIIVKNKTSAYVLDGRPNKTWYKVKAAVTMDMIVTGYTEGTGKYEGLIGTIEFSRMGADGEPVYVGRCSGMTDELRKDITNNRASYLGRVVEVKSNELVGSKEYRSPRHPQFVSFRFDKKPEDCTGEELRQ